MSKIVKCLAGVASMAAVACGAYFVLGPKEQLGPRNTIVHLSRGACGRVAKPSAEQLFHQFKKHWRHSLLEK